MSDPVNRKIHETSLVHQTEFRIAKLCDMDSFCPLKIRADFIKILSVSDSVENLIHLFKYLSVLFFRFTGQQTVPNIYVVFGSICSVSTMCIFYSTDLGLSTGNFSGTPYFT